MGQCHAGRHRGWPWATAAALLLGCSPALQAADWLDALGRPSATAREGLRLLAGAADDGLMPNDYRAADLTLQAARLADGGDAVAAATFARSLEAGLHRYLRDLHQGRVNPARLGFRLGTLPRATPDYPALLSGVAGPEELVSVAAGLRPRLSQYRHLRAELARYRALASANGWPPLPATPSVRSGQRYEHAAALHRQLVALGDLPAGSPAPALPLYDSTLASGVARFQGRHGLAVDGILGRATRAALNVPLAARIEQLEFALERLRWLPRLDERRMIGINIPMFSLWAWGPERDAGTPLSMSVVVGRALDTRTPVLAADLSHLVIRPYWNVPRSIVRKEILPALRRHPAELQSRDMEIVRGASDDAQPVPVTPENLTLLEQGELRLRQRVGAGNALGLVKFVFPNDADVYLHGTPATALFGRPRRDFSHGCVRLEDPVALAQWVLADRPEWTRDRILRAMADETAASRHVPLTAPIPVILFYTTAMVTPGDHRLHFADDIYRHDARLRRALQQRPPS